MVLAKLEKYLVIGIFMDNNQPYNKNCLQLIICCC